MCVAGAENGQNWHGMSKKDAQGQPGAAADVVHSKVAAQTIRLCACPGHRARMQEVPSTVRWRRASVVGCCAPLESPISLLPVAGGEVCK